MKKCPHCQSNQFKAYIKRPGVIKMNEDGSTTIIKELDKFAYDVVECLKCNKKVTNDELITDVECSKCKTLTKPEELVDDLCPVCHALKDRPELSKATPEELVRRILEMEKELKAKTADKVVKKVKESDKAEEDKVAEQKEETKPVKAEEKKETKKEEPKKNKDTKEDKKKEEVKAPADKVEAKDQSFNIAPPEINMDEPF